MKNVLLNTCFFPTMYTQWRMVEIKSFIEYYDCDIGVLSVYKHYKDTFSWSYDECKSYYHLEEYNILIFHEEFNYLNKFNTNFDGTLFNLTKTNENLFPFCYMFVKKNRPINPGLLISPPTPSGMCTVRKEPIGHDLTIYDQIYHIFFNNFNFFNNLCKIPYEKHAIRLYPGGGITFDMENLTLDNKIKLITTNIKTTELVKKSNLSNFKQILFGPMIDKNEIIPKKKLTTEKLSILFSTSGGYPKEDYVRKGYFRYIELIQYIKSIGKSECFNFYCVGAIQSCFRVNSLDIIYTELLPQKEFNKLLINTIDITINLHNGGTDGFPQGIEALIHGCVGILTDPHNFNEKTSINFINEEEIYLVPYNIDYSILYNILENLDKDREKLLKLSNKSQKKIYDECCFEKQFKDLFHFLDN